MSKIEDVTNPNLFKIEETSRFKRKDLKDEPEKETDLESATVGN